MSSFTGFVSSNRKCVRPPNSSASVKLIHMALACPMQVAVRLRRKAGNDFLDFTGLQVFGNNIFMKLRGAPMVLHVDQPFVL